MFHMVVTRTGQVFGKAIIALLEPPFAHLVHAPTKPGSSQSML